MYAYIYNSIYGSQGQGPMVSSLKFKVWVAGFGFEGLGHIEFSALGLGRVGLKIFRV